MLKEAVNPKTVKQAKAKSAIDLKDAELDPVHAGRETINQITSFIDGSLVYGSDVGRLRDS